MGENRSHERGGEIHNFKVPRITPVLLLRVLAAWASLAWSLTIRLSSSLRWRLHAPFSFAAFQTAGQRTRTSPATAYNTIGCPTLLSPETFRNGKAAGSRIWATPPVRLAQALPTHSPKLDSRRLCQGHAAAIEPPGYLGPQLDEHTRQFGRHDHAMMEVPGAEQDKKRLPWRETVERALTLDQ